MGYSQNVDTLESFIPLFFSHQKSWHSYFFIEGVKPSPDRKMIKLLTFSLQCRRFLQARNCFASKSARLIKTPKERSKWGESP